jgi:DNA-binding response OmpR family regulator
MEAPMRNKILVLGHEEVTSWVSDTLVPKGFVVVRLFELPESLTILKQEGFEMVVVDSCMPEVENVCFRLAWLCRMRIAVISRDPQYDMNLLAHLGVDAFISPDSPPSELFNDIEVIISRGPQQFDNIRVLVIEDDRHIREAIRLCFRIYWPEAELNFADEGQTGINIIKNKAVDMVLLDLGLPDISGFEVLSWVRNFSQAPVIILTAARDREHVLRAINAGANDYLVKPFKQIELMPRIRKYAFQYARSK